MRRLPLPPGAAEATTPGLQTSSSPSAGSKSQLSTVITAAGQKQPGTHRSIAAPGLQQMPRHPCSSLGWTASHGDARSLRRRHIPQRWRGEGDAGGGAGSLFIFNSPVAARRMRTMVPAGWKRSVS